MTVGERTPSSDTTSEEPVGDGEPFSVTGPNRDAEAADAESESRRVPDFAAEAAQWLGAGSKRAARATVAVADQIANTTQGLLASALSADLNGLFQSAVKGTPTIYDKAMDAAYLDPLLRGELGGSLYHRMFDGGHTVWGAFQAARDASPDDTVVQEVWGTVQGLMRDGTTARGLPFATWDKATFDSVSGWLESSLGVPKSWFYDMNTYDAAELLGSGVGTVALIFGWNRADTEEFAKLVGGMGLSAAVSANPLLLVVTLVGQARAFQKARQEGDYTALVEGQVKGGIGAGAALGAVALVGVAGGPAGAGLLAGVAAGILAHAATRNVSLAEVGEFAAERSKAAASGVKVAGGFLVDKAGDAVAGARVAGGFLVDKAGEAASGARVAGGFLVDKAGDAASGARSASGFVADKAGDAAAGDAAAAGARAAGAVAATGAKAASDAAAAGARAAGAVAATGAKAAGDAAAAGARIAGEYAAQGAVTAVFGVRSALGSVADMAGDVASDAKAAGGRGLEELRSRRPRKGGSSDS